MRHQQTREPTALMYASILKFNSRVRGRASYKHKNRIQRNAQSLREDTLCWPA